MSTAQQRVANDRFDLPIEERLGATRCSFQSALEHAEALANAIDYQFGRKVLPAVKEDVFHIGLLVALVGIGRAIDTLAVTTWRVAEALESLKEKEGADEPSQR